MTDHQQHATAQAFRTLHLAKHGFITPNAWDVGTARIFEAEGFNAIGTTSAGIAFSLGKQDYHVGQSHPGVSRGEMFAQMRLIAEAVNIPVNGDLEAGYGDTPYDVAETVQMAIDAGLAGGNIEDKKPLENALYDEDIAVERIAAAHEAALRKGNNFVVTARTDAFQLPTPDAFETVVRRANRFLEAGADCVFAPGAADIKTIKRLIQEINGPINVVVGLSSAEGNAHDIIALGIQRISIGGSLARSVLGYVRQCARDLQDKGDFNYPTPQITQPDLNALFSHSSSSN